MKICVFFQPKDKYDNFEGARLRKSIKGALELVDVPYSRNLIDNYDVIHFVSPDDELKISDAKEEGIPTVFSAGLAETDISTRLFELKGDNHIISARALRTLNKVDLILTCDEVIKDLLIKNGVHTKIEVVPLGVNTARFEMTSQLQSDIFYNYYQLSKDTKFVVSVGSYEDKEKFKALLEIARFCPNYNFYYFGRSKSKRKAPKIKNAPRNISFHLLVNDEIYCSMMKNASVFLAFDNRRYNPITLFDAAASKTQIVALSPLYNNKDLLRKLNAYVGDSTPEVASIITKIMNGELETKTELAYKVAQENSLRKLGLALKKNYDSLLKGEDEND